MRVWVALWCALWLLPAWGERDRRPASARPELATTPTAQTPTARTATAERPVTLSIQDKARLWRLPVEDYRRYLTLMQGPRGIWSPAADPLSVLGAAAETDAERARYARISITLERARLEGEKAYRDVVRKVLQERGADDLYDPTQFTRVLRQAAAKRTASAVREGDHLLFFTELECARCDMAFVRALERFKSTRRVQLDVYLQGADSDQAINRWAATHQLPRDLFGGRLTLNHDRGVLTELLGVEAYTRPLPLLLVERNDQLRVMEPRP